jgi:hypothetical protein
MHTSDPRPQNGLEVVVYNTLFCGMLGHPPLIVFEAIDVVFSSPGIHSQMKEFGICTPLFDISYASILFLPSSLNDRKSDDLSFQTKVLLHATAKSLAGWSRGLFSHTKVLLHAALLVILH